MINTKDGIIGFIIGDALGVPAALSKKEEREKNPITDMVDGGIHKKEVGTFSDASSLTLATIDSMLEKGGIDYYDIALKYQDFINYSKYTADNDLFDIGRTTLKSIINYSDKNPLECGDDSFYSNDNGALMRMLPLAYLLYTKKDSELKIEIKKFSSMTHRHEISILGSYIYVKYIQFLLQGKSKETAFKLLKELSYDDFSIDAINCYKRIFNNNILIDEIKSTTFIVDTLESVFYSILTTSSYDEAVLKSINLGGEADTVGAITGSIAGIIYGYDSINKKWIEKLKKRKIIEKITIYFTELVNKKNKRW